MKSIVHFDLSEFFIHCEVTERKLAMQRSDVINNIMKLCVILEAVRDSSPIIISSCYRDINHNRRAGGVSNSQHLNGAAVDFHCQNLDRIFDRLKTFEFHQLIRYPTFIHFGLPTGVNDNQIIYK